jgi:hypothetical protein
MKLDHLKSEHPDLLWISHSAYESVQDKLEKMKRKAAKLRVPMPEVTIQQDVVATVVEGHDPLSGAPRFRDVPYYGVIVIGEPVVLDGWRFVAVLEHTEHGNVLRRMPGATEEEIPSFYRSTTTALCEHCHTKRRRNDTYLVFHEDDYEWRQVGSTCLKDHLGGHDPAGALWLASILTKIVVAVENEERAWFGRWEQTVPAASYLGCVQTFTRLDGYLSKSKAAINYELGVEPVIATAIKAWEAMNPTPSIGRGKSESQLRNERWHEERDEADYDFAEMAIDFVLGIEDESEFMHNIQVVCMLDNVSYKHTGLLAYAVVLYKRELDRIEREKNQRDLTGSEHVGEVKDRIGFGVVEVLGVRVWEGRFGVQHIHRFLDQDGNVLVWWTDDDHAKAGDLVDLTGTVKKHGEYNDVAETTLTRCRVVMVEAAEEAA